MIGATVALVATLLAAPVVVCATIAIGLGDTWLSLRERAEAAAEGQP